MTSHIKVKLEKIYSRPSAKYNNITGYDLSRAMKKHWDREHDIVLAPNTLERKIVVEILPTYFGHPNCPFKCKEDYIAYLADMSYILNSHGVGEMLAEKISKLELAPYVSFLPTSMRPVKIVLDI